MTGEEYKVFREAEAHEAYLKFEHEEREAGTELMCRECGFLFHRTGPMRSMPCPRCEGNDTVIKVQG